MRPRLLPLYVLVILAAVLALPAAARIGPGDKFVEFSLEKRGGGTARYPEDFRGKVVFVDFWASWCPECKVELPELAKLDKKYRGKPFALLAVNVDQSQKEAERFLERYPVDLLVLFDANQKLIQEVAPVGMPASFLIGPDGVVYKQYVGFQNGYIETYQADIEALLATMPPEASAAQETEKTHSE
jgi:thiol-disulfide isomerase/thioredoxin